MRLRWFLTMTTILMATVALTVLVSTALDPSGDGGEGDEQVIVDPGPADSTTTTAPAATGVAAGATRVSGTVTAGHLEGAVLAPREVPAPFTITADRGFGNGGRISGVLVDGAPATIEWDAGRPFVMSSGGALVVDPVRVDLVPEGLRVFLADAVHDLTPGMYHLDTPVAVGTSGVAGARESVDFEAVEGSAFEGRGDATIVLPGDQLRRLLGPGVVHLEGTLELSGPAGPRAVTTLDAAEGPFDLTLTPAPGGAWTVEGLLGGQLTAG